jgi:hypothetical protein
MIIKILPEEISIDDQKTEVTYSAAEETDEKSATIKPKAKVAAHESSLIRVSIDKVGSLIIDDANRLSANYDYPTYTPNFQHIIR